MEILIEESLGDTFFFNFGKINKLMRPIMSNYYQLNCLEPVIRLELPITFIICLEMLEVYGIDYHILHIL